MKYCSKCGEKTASDGQKFCFKCGAPLQARTAVNENSGIRTERKAQIDYAHEWKPKKKKGKVIAVIVCAVVIAAGAAFGGYTLYKRGILQKYIPFISWGEGENEQTESAEESADNAPEDDSAGKPVNADDIIIEGRHSVDENGRDIDKEISFNPSEKMAREMGEGFSDYDKLTDSLLAMLPEDIRDGMRVTTDDNNDDYMKTYENSDESVSLEVHSFTGENQKGATVFYEVYAATPEECYDKIPMLTDFAEKSTDIHLDDTAVLAEFKETLEQSKDNSMTICGLHNAENSTSIAFVQSYIEGNDSYSLQLKEELLFN